MIENDPGRNSPSPAPDQGTGDVGRHHHRLRPPPVAGVPAGRDQGGAGNAVGGQHGAEQQHAAVGGEHVPGQGDRVAGVAHVGGDLPDGQQPEAAVAERGQGARRGQGGHQVSSAPGLGAMIGCDISSVSTGSDPAGRRDGSSSLPPSRDQRIMTSLTSVFIWRSSSTVR
jgi:hypothetical protein